MWSELFVFLLFPLFVLFIYIVGTILEQEIERVIHVNSNQRYIWYDPDLGPEQEYCKYIRVAMENKLLDLNSDEVSYSCIDGIIKIKEAEFQLNLNTFVTFNYLETSDQYYIHIC